MATRLCQNRTRSCLGIFCTRSKIRFLRRFRSPSHPTRYLFKSSKDRVGSDQRRLENRLQVPFTLFDMFLARSAYTSVFLLSSLCLSAGLMWAIMTVWQFPDRASFSSLAGANGWKWVGVPELDTWGIFVIFSIIKNDFCYIFYKVNNIFLHQSYLKSPLPVKLTW